MINRMNRALGVLLCLMILLQPLCVFARGLDTSRKCNLELTYSSESTAFPDLEIRVYRVARTTGLGIFEKVAPYDRYPVEVTNITSQTEWNEVATTLRGYVQVDGIQPYSITRTDGEGRASFENLETGLYLVAGVTAQTADETYVFFDFMLSLPGVQDGVYTYDVSAKPKSRKTGPSDDPVTYTVLKLWKDEGHENRRPADVTVDLLQDGAVVETVILNARNDWKYSFQCEDGKSTWTVVERNVPKGYAVKVIDKGTSFVIVNTWEQPPVDPPETGETFPLRLYIVVTCFAGFLLLILGVTFGRKSHEQEK